MLDEFLDLENFLTALRSVPLWQVGLELLVIGAVIYWVIRFLQGTRGARLLKGIIFLLITLYLGVRLLGAVLDLSRLEILFDRFLFYASFAIIIVFQPELRRALMRLGETRLFRGSQHIGDEIEQIVDACATLSRRRIGALIAIERDVALGSFTEEATRIDGDVSSALLQTIFFPNTALHDLGVIISGNKIAYAGVQFPLAESGDLPRELGSRHRAAVGLSQESDALVIVVSEETGDISIAERGQLFRRRTIDQLKSDLTEKMGQSVTMPLEDPEVRPTVILPGDRTRLAERSTVRVGERREGEGAATTMSATRPPAAETMAVTRTRPPPDRDVTQAPPGEADARFKTSEKGDNGRSDRHEDPRPVEQVDLR
jgi:diadenylate cyclase